MDNKKILEEQLNEFTKNMTVEEHLNFVNFIMAAFFAGIEYGKKIAR